MFRNYLKTAFRTLKKNVGFTAINVFGLALGLATCLLIIFYVVDELSYDKFNVKADRIYRANMQIKFGGIDQSYASSPSPLAAVFQNDYPEVERACRLLQRGGYNVKKGNQTIHENRMVLADSTLFDVFTLPMIAGDPKKALVEPNTVVITESTAKRYFNNTQVMGKTFTFDEKLLYKVTGVIKDLPRQSHFRYDFFLSMASNAESKDGAWFSNNFNTYVLLKPGVDAKKFEDKFPALMHKYAGPQLQSILHLTFDSFEGSGNKYQLSLMPLKDIHLKSNLVSELDHNGNIQYVYIFGAVAIFILLIACVNFMNLSTARSANRAREVGVRKVLGSRRQSLIAQFLSESIMVTFIATVIAMLTAYFLLPVFNNIAGKTMELNMGSLIWLIPALLVMVLVIGFLAGSYPAFFLSAFQPIDVLKGKLSSGFKGGMLRSSLVVFQFFISIVLIIGTLVIYNQLKYIQNKDLGYNRSQVLVIHGVYDLGNKSKVLRDEVKQLPGVMGVTMTGFLPTSDYRNSSSVFQERGLDPKKAVLAQTWVVDDNYLPTLGIKLTKGRNFSSQMPTDSAAMIVNETAAKLMGVRDPLNKPMYLPMDNMAKTFKEYHIVGVIKDFNFASLRNNVSPVILMYGQDKGALSVKVNTANITALMVMISDKWKSIKPGKEFEYSFMDDDFDSSYRAEQRMGTIFIIFTSLTIVIACLGLFGLAAYAAEQRTKEIGIRKVLGANVGAIVGMLSKDFIKLVMIAIVIAIPVAWVAMQQWLQGFAYRQNIQWWVIVLAAVLAVLIAFVTISFQSIKAALANPVRSLKNE
ncbi:ABC transporter permease [Mucilaginibacter gossypii]|uniref:ABC transporter permease n=1 Tax=Mucilaginibacter gossypii TaxID=551996 RepID=UPI000DCD15E7|nr:MULTISPECIES: ABC transporter permease [Mucilaginibacter]QTE38289.1 ABC transporter permease [Mucilaginibacter gossypii]RAV49291.1 ABC transporter permease [Mucilaginibacter rubeus]